MHKTHTVANSAGSRAIADAMEKLAVEAMAEMQQQQQGVGPLTALIFLGKEDEID